MNPAACLVLDMTPGDRGRGPFDATPWLELDADVRVDAFPFSDEALDWLIDQADVIFAVEGPPPSHDDFADRCAAAGVEFVIHVNPELYRPSYRGATTRLTLPTSWHAERFPDATLLPMPVDRERFPFTLRTKATTFLHVSAPAFHDRNGTALLLESLQHVESPITMLMHGVAGMNRCEDRIGNVRVVYTPPCADHRDVYPLAADVLVLPRRYGGQSLTVNEAASLGLPCLTLDLPPLNNRPGVATVPVPYQSGYTVGMIGGNEHVWACQPGALAGAIDALVREPERVAALSLGADAWASEHSWGALLPTWREALRL